MQKRPDRPLLPELYEFERQFEEKYNRPMTAEERRWFEFIKKRLLKQSEEERQTEDR
jgi:hypothetical protein